MNFFTSELSAMASVIVPTGAVIYSLGRMSERMDEITKSLDNLKDNHLHHINNQLIDLVERVSRIEGYKK